MKWQWSKVSSMLGDYQEFIKTWGEAVNSQGFTAEQVDVQLSTLSRKTKMLVADMQGLMVNEGNNGLTAFFKGVVTKLDAFVLGLRKVPDGAYTAATGIVLLTFIVNKLTKGWQEFTIAQNLATAATNNFAKASIFLSRANILIGALTMLGVAAAFWTEKLGEAAAKEREEASKKQDLISIQEQQLEQMKRQGEFVDTLFGAREKLLQQYNDEKTSAEKKIVLNKDIQATEQELTNVLGNEAMERIKQNNYSQESIEREKTVFQNSIIEKRNALISMRQGMRDDLDAKIIWLQNCIDAYYKEVDAFADSISKKIKLLGIWKAALLTMQEWETAGIERGVSSKKEQLDKYIARGGTDQTIISNYQEQIANMEAEAQKSRDAGSAIVNEGLNNWKAQLEEAKTARINLGATIDFNPIAAGGNNYEPTDSKKKKGSGSGGGIPPSDISNRIQIDAYKLAQDKMFNEAKIKSDLYSTSLDNLNTKEALYGKTVEVSAETLDLKTKRIKELTDEEKKYTNEADYLEGLINDQISSNEELQTTLGVTADQWKNMSKEERNSYKMDRREILDQLNLTKAQTQAMFKYREEASKAKKEASKLTNDITKDMFGGVFDVDKQRSRRLSNIGNQESIAMANVDYARPLGFQRENVIKLDAERQRYEEYKNKATQLNDELKVLYDTELKEAEQNVENAKNKLKMAEAMDEGIEKTKALKAATDELTEAIKLLNEARNGNTAKQQTNLDAQLSNTKDMENSMKAQKELAKKTSDEIKQYWADSFLDMAQNGTEFKDIMKNVWKQVQRDALYAALGIDNKNPGVITKLFGKSSSNTSTPSGGKKFGGKHATGGIVNVPSIAGEDGEEVIIPVEKNTQNSKKLIEYASNKTGYTPQISSYVPYFKNESLATQPIVNVQVQQQQNHIKELEKQTQVMAAMLNHMMNNQGGNSGGITVISTQMSDQQILEAINRNPSALSNIMGRHNNGGWR